MSFHIQHTKFNTPPNGYPRFSYVCEPNQRPREWATQAEAEEELARLREFASDWETYEILPPNKLLTPPWK